MRDSSASCYTLWMNSDKRPCMNNGESRCEKRRPAFRPEAWPARYSTLTEQQKDAVERVVTFVWEAVRSIDGSQRRPSGGSSVPPVRLPSWADRRPKSQTVFLHGYRGMGKTTVLLSAIDACSRGNKADYNSDLWKRIQEIRYRVVWLEPIATEHLPRTYLKTA
jgi:hypothetical protein